MSDFAEYSQYDALGLAELVRTGKVTPGELVEAAITRMEAVNPRLNAVIHTMADHARELARGERGTGRFAGVPFLIKDLLAIYAGQPFRCGSRALRDFVPDHDSELVTRFKATGVIPIGKTNTPELGLVPLTEPELFGPTHNPWDTAYSPSGSSGGSAAAVAARIVPMASGGDGGGSIRTPASACGVFGLKPTRARNPNGPDSGEHWEGAAVEHVLTRSVRDSAAMLDATAGPDIGAPYFAPPPARPFVDEVTSEPGKLRIGFTTQSLLGNHVDGECVAGVEATAALLEELGHEVIEVTVAPGRARKGSHALAIDRRPFTRAYLLMICGQTATEIAAWTALRGSKVTSSELELPTRVIQLLGQATSAVEYNQSIRYLHHASRDIQVFFEDHDILLTPTLAQPPPLTGALQPSGVERTLLGGFTALRLGGVMRMLGLLDKAAASTFEFLAFTPVFNVTGQPAMSVPLHWSSKGLPIGMHFAARYADEATLFRLAGQLERARPWADRKPAVCAA